MPTKGTIMRNKIIVVGVIAAFISFRGARSHRPVKGTQPETLRKKGSS